MTRLFSIGAFCALLSLIAPLPASAAGAAPQLRDGAHDFDFGIGAWHTHIKRRLHPLSGSDEWVQADGTVITRPIWGGKAQLEELTVGAPVGPIEGITLRMYDQDAHQWKLYWVDSDDGALGNPVIGEFKDGVGSFYDQDEIDGRSVLVRNVYSDASADGYHFEQAFSADGGKTWETNFVASLTRDKQGSLAPEAEVQGLDADNHAFDWQFGDWDIHMSRLKDPLTGSTAWTDLDGTVKVRRIWGGKGNLAEIDTSGPSGHLEFLALRLYNPKAHQWSLSFASSKGGSLGVPMYGAFKDGRGDFYDQEPYADKMIQVRFSFLDIAGDAARDEQAFSTDGGKTWEVNWVNTHKRRPVNSDASH